MNAVLRVTTDEELSAWATWLTALEDLTAAYEECCRALHLLQRSLPDDYRAVHWLELCACLEEIGTQLNAICAALKEVYEQPIENGTNNIT